MAIDPDVAQLLTEVNARLTALEVTPDAPADGKIPIKYVVTYADGTVATYDLTSTI